MSVVPNEATSAFQQTLGYTFRDRDLLERALTHKSYSNENREARSPNNERLEFLGDAVLGFVVGELIYRSFPNLQEGALSKIKAHLVSASMLSTKARNLGIGRFLRMGAGEARSGGAEKSSLLADAFEAVVAAVYLDGGLAATEELLQRVFGPEVSGIDIGDLSFHDYKTTLQETAQSLGLPLPEYRVIEESGPDHEKAFVVELAWDGDPFARGVGPSKREAQRKAAKEALKKLGRLPA
ncbi:MAG TPA: ribonuclease III [Thermoanaerobaculia bacterium]|nr:ribonuclease III [Thermoanaerobaculia bacterium]